MWLKAQDAHPLPWHRLALGVLGLAALGAAFACLIIASGRSLYAPGVGATLGLDAGVGMLVGFGAGGLGYALHARSRREDAGTPGFAWVAAPATAVGFLIGAGATQHLEQVARSSVFLFGVGFDYVVVAAALGAWGLLVGIATLLPGARRLRLTMFASGTFLALGVASVLTGGWLLANLARLQAIARARNTGIEAWVILIALVVAVMMRRRDPAP